MDSPSPPLPRLPPNQPRVCVATRCNDRTPSSKRIKSLKKKELNYIGTGQRGLPPPITRIPGKRFYNNSTDQNISDIPPSLPRTGRRYIMVKEVERWTVYAEMVSELGRTHGHSITSSFFEILRTFSLNVLKNFGFSSDFFSEIWFYRNNFPLAYTQSGGNDVCFAHKFTNQLVLTTAHHPHMGYNLPSFQRSILLESRRQESPGVLCYFVRISRIYRTILFIISSVYFLFFFVTGLLKFREEIVGTGLPGIPWP